MMKTLPPLREYIQEAVKSKTAIGHFNISNLEMLHGILAARATVSKEVGRDVPVIIGISEGERDWFGINEAVNLIKNYREEKGLPIFLNADHTYSVERVKEAIDSGFDAVIYDGTDKPYDENVSATKECVEYAIAYTKRTGRDVLIEAELGFIGKSSKVLDSIPDNVQITEEFLTKPEDAKRFIDVTGADMLAPAIGNIHGMLKGGKDPALHTDLVGRIREAVGIPLVLHGGSGGSIDDFVGAVVNGCAIVHISTEIRVAFRKALEKGLSADLNDVAPYKYMKGTVSAVADVVADKIRLFASPKK